MSAGPAGAGGGACSDGGADSGGGGNAAGIRLPPRGKPGTVIPPQLASRKVTISSNAATERAMARSADETSSGKGEVTRGLRPKRRRELEPIGHPRE